MYVFVHIILNCIVIFTTKTLPSDNHKVHSDHGNYEEKYKWCDPDVTCKLGYFIGIVTKKDGNYEINDVVHFNNTKPVRIDGIIPGYLNTVKIRPKFNCTNDIEESKWYVLNIF